MEAQLQRQAVDPVVLARAARWRRAHAAAHLAHGVDALDQHQRADHAEERHVADGDEEIEQAEAAQAADQLHAERPSRRCRRPAAPAPMVKSMLRRRHWANAPDTEEATICADSVPTATAGGMPEKISSGVIRKPPPTPNMPGEKADRSAHGEEDEDVRRHLGDGQIEVHTSPRCPTDRARRMPRGRGAARSGAVPARRHQVEFGPRTFTSAIDRTRTSDIPGDAEGRSAGSATRTARVRERPGGRELSSCR